MSEESKMSGGGAVAPPLMSASDDRKSSSESIPEKKVQIKSTDMGPVMLNEAIGIAVAAFEKCNVEKDVAENIKKVFDNKYGATWHCVVGSNFGSYVTHEANHFIYLYLDSKAVLLFKSG